MPVLFDRFRLDARRACPVILAGVFFLGLVACSGSQDSPSGVERDSALSEVERSKIDPDLLRLMTDSVKVTDVPAVQGGGGTWFYAVWVQAQDLDALASAGVSTDSLRDGEVWTRLSLDEVREVARLQAVTGIRADNDPEPRRQ